MQLPGLSQITASLVDLPLKATFSTAATHMVMRRLIVLKVGSDGLAGWGEVAPVPGHSAIDVDAVWDSLQQTVERFGLDAPHQTGGMLYAGFAQAAADLAARTEGRPLWRHLGGTQPAFASAAIGLDRHGHPDLDQLQSVADAGYLHAKLKITRAIGVDAIAEAIRHFPDITFGVDANGSLDLDDLDCFDQLDQLGLAYIEQPGPVDDLAGHHRLKQRLTTPVCLDESAGSIATIDKILAVDAADIINLKVGRFGTYETLRIAAKIAAVGRKVRLGGLVESGIGRGHSVALASHPVFAVVGDLAGSDRYFDDDLVRPQWHAAQGRLTPPDSPGLGVTIDEKAIASVAVASMRVR